MTDFIKWLTDLISQLGNWGYFLLALISFLEAIPIVGFFIPGVVILIFGGFLVSIKVFDFFDLVVLCAGFTFLGDMAAFALGHRFAGSFKRDHKIIKESYLIRAEKFVAQRGSMGVFWGRFISPVRTMLYFVLGLIKMPWLKFIFPVATSSFIFVMLYVGVGYLAGNAWQTFSAWSGRLAAIIAGFIIILFIVWWLKGFLVHQGRQLKILIHSILKTFFAWYQRTAWWHKFSKKYPSFSQGLVKSTDPNKFFGLPLFALWLANAILAIIFFVLAWLALSPVNFIVDFDYRLQALVSLFAEKHLAIVMFLFTMLGSAYFVLVVGVLVSLWLFLEKRKSYIMGLWVMLSGLFLTSSLFKVFFARPRPSPTFLSESSYSFPSFHAAIALALLMYLVYYAVRAYPRWSRNISLTLIASLLVLVIGFSRIYLGVHYFSDVLAGFIIGAFWFIKGVISQRHLEIIDQPKRLSRMFQVIVLAIIFIVLAGFYTFQIFEHRGVSASFFKGLDKVIKKQEIPLATNELRGDLLLTENLVGVVRRPINFIFNTEESKINETLVKAGWLKRLEPTLSSVVGRGTSTIFKKPYLDAPLRPRFWNNQSNSLTFTKTVPDNKQIDFYVLRLWPVINPQTNKADKFIGELAVNRDFSWSSLFKKQLLDPAIKTLITDLTASSNFSKLETKVFKVQLDKDTKKEIEATIYVVNFK